MMGRVARLDRWWILNVALVLVSTQATAQVSTDEAYRRLRERQTHHVATRPATMPATQSILAGPKKIAFILDVGGRMVNRFSTIKAETSRAIEAFQSADSFNIYCESAGKVSAFAAALVHGTPEMKLGAEAFLDDRVVPQGVGGFGEAIVAANKDGAQALWVASDGDLEPKER